MTTTGTDRCTRWRARATRLLHSALALVLISMMYFMGVYSERTGFVDQVLDPGIRRATHPVLNAFRGKPPAVPVLRLEFNESDRDSLDRIRAIAMEQGWLESAGNPLFSAKASVDDRGLGAWAGLREGNAEILSGRRWPWHVRLSPGDSLLGMSTFDLVPVDDTRQLWAWLFLRLLQEEGIPVLGHGFIDLHLNGRDLGLYAVEGRVDGRQLKHWGLGPGPVVRFDDGLLMNTRRAMAQRIYPSEMPAQGDWLTAPILASRLDRVLEDPESTRRFQSAVIALEALRDGRSTPSAILDVDRLARLLALSDVFGATAAVEWWSMRFLADSLTGKLIALPQRGLAGEPIGMLLGVRGQEAARAQGRAITFHGRLFGDTAIHLRYIAWLDTFSTLGRVEAMLDRVSAGLDEKEKILRAAMPDAALTREVIEHDLTVVRQTLRPRDLLLAYTQAGGGERRRLSVANVHSLPVIVDMAIAGQDTMRLSRPVLLYPREAGKPLFYRSLVLDRPVAQDLPITLLAATWGLRDRSAVPVRTWSTLPAN